MIIKRLLRHSLLLPVGILYVLLITTASLWRFINFNPIPVANGDKIGHCIAYLGFATVWFMVFYFSERWRYNWNQSLIRSAIFAILYGILMEIAQNVLTNYRMSEFYDVLANVSGTILAVLILSVLKKPISSLKSI